jgi:16S rRNA (uracil1498-N3)-methyltransferase
LDESPGPATHLLITVGPEGGLTDEEVALFADRGGNAVTLGPRVLRTETAALVGLAQILYARE